MPSTAAAMRVSVGGAHPRHSTNVSTSSSATPARIEKTYPSAMAAGSASAAARASDLGRAGTSDSSGRPTWADRTGPRTAPTIKNSRIRAAATAEIT